MQRNCMDPSNLWESDTHENCTVSVETFYMYITSGGRSRVRNMSVKLKLAKYVNSKLPDWYLKYISMFEYYGRV